MNLIAAGYSGLCLGYGELNRFVKAKELNLKPSSAIPIPLPTRFRTS